jgi:cytochrome c-type biogenesis protein CcmE
MRVKGWVKHGSMQWDARTNELAFALAHKDDTESVPVAYKGILPDMFAEGREVVVEGRYVDGGLTARQIMTSCPSKYEPAKAEGEEAQS